MLKTINLSTYYYFEDRTVKAVDDVSLEVREGEFFGLAGDSGCGKSTIAFSIMGLIETPGKIVFGKIFLDGEDISSYGQDRMASIRGGKIGMVFQDPFTSLNPVLRVGEQIAESIMTHSSITHAGANEKVLQALGDVRVQDPARVVNMYPHELSGGMRQRVVIAMALAGGPRLIVADEPTTALDVTTQKHIMDLMADLHRDKGLSVILISHNLRLIERYCSRAALMDRGRVIFEGSPGSITEAYEKIKS